MIHSKVEYAYYYALKNFSRHLLHFLTKHKNAKFFDLPLILKKSEGKQNNDVILHNNLLTYS